jgi:hypothetical protein
MAGELCHSMNVQSLKPPMTPRGDSNPWIRYTERDQTAVKGLKCRRDHGHMPTKTAAVAAARSNTMSHSKPAAVLEASRLHCRKQLLRTPINAVHVPA